MPFAFANPTRQRLINGLVVLAALFTALIWGLELRRSLDSLTLQAEERILAHKDQELERKLEGFRDLFNELYNNTRTITLLPMIRSVQGKNRLSEKEDVVAAGRFSLDAHHTMQQIYLNLRSHLKVSEIYYVLDGFDPSRHVPFFMYDDLIAENGEVQPPPVGVSDVSIEVEEFEYAFFPKQLAWFRAHAPTYTFTKQLEKIPVRLSPMMRTCDNSQFLSEKNSDPRDVEGLIYAMPVYDLEASKLHGMITTVIRRNVLEAILIGVPFLPVTARDQLQMTQEGWTMPQASSPFVLRNPELGIDIFDRRHPLLKQGVNAALAEESGRWFKQSIDLRTGSPWELHYHMDAAEIADLNAVFETARRETLVGRLALLVLLASALFWMWWLSHRGRRELVRLAHFDALTELPNRRAFFERLDNVMARAKRQKTCVGLFFVDVANFNAINDAFGQSVGDQLLSVVGQRLVESVRGADTVTRKPLTRRPSESVSRLGGDEFTILCEDISSADDLAVVADRIMSSMGPSLVVGGNELVVSVYVGIAAYPEDGNSGEALLMSAESAMNQCRASGPGYLLFNEAMRKRAARQHLLAVELAPALERQQFELFYQPKAALDDGQVVSLEALIRWKHPELGMISPFEFIPLLERSGRIVEVGEWVLRQSCHDIQALARLGYGHLKVSANVSVRQLRRGNFHETVARVLADTAIAPDRLVLEITESMMMDNLQEGQLELDRLKDLGVGLAIDDFGTGYSSLTYLQCLPLDYLKLDKSFIDGMTNDHARHIVKTVIVLAQGLQLQTIAEGIETEAQRLELHALGCDIIQGYLLSQPKPLMEIVQWMADRRALAGQPPVVPVAD